MYLDLEDFRCIYIVSLAILTEAVIGSSMLHETFRRTCKRRVFKHRFVRKEQQAPF